MSESKLFQVVAAAAAKKNPFLKEKTELHRLLTNATLFEGMQRTYAPNDEEGEKQPPETKIVQQDAQKLLSQLVANSAAYYDLVLTQDVGNTLAKADVIVDGEVLIKDVPATHLLFLEQQVTDMITIIEKLPTLDSLVVWNKDSQTGGWRSNPVETNRTKKTNKPITLAPATEKHPAQVQMVTEDIVVGVWSAVRNSTLLSPTQRQACLDRAMKLKLAVIDARHRANTTEVENKTGSEKLLKYVFNFS